MPQKAGDKPLQDSLKNLAFERSAGTRQGVRPIIIRLPFTSDIIILCPPHCIQKALYAKTQTESARHRTSRVEERMSSSPVISALY